MIDVVKKQTTIQPTDQENEYLVQESTTLKVEDHVNLSAAAQTVAVVQSAIEKFEESSGTSGSVSPSEAATKIVTDQLGLTASP